MTNQQKQIIAHMKTYGSITNIEAMRELGMCDFRKRISELRKLGYDIVDIQEANTNNYCYHERYFLKGEPANG